jgi:hypothetical protein
MLIVSPITDAPSAPPQTRHQDSWKSQGSAQACAANQRQYISCSPVQIHASNTCQHHNTHADGCLHNDTQGQACPSSIKSLRPRQAIEARAAGASVSMPPGNPRRLSMHGETPSQRCRPPHAMQQKIHHPSSLSRREENTPGPTHKHPFDHPHPPSPRV